ncbi:hypothetical protein [Bradyrhizobium sp. 1(2017)]|jgi:hypothetical protein|uniref:hypothetical protein n=1 Tax=Bradyrhizobium sp. 1(2017) TaxID=1404888 RepID=UPI002FE5DA87
MPLLAYFWKVGAALLALLFVADFCLPKVPIAEKAVEDRPAIHIHSDRKWPERVALDTSMPVIVAAAPEIAIAQATALPVPPEPPIVRAETLAVANALAMVRTGPPPREAVDRQRRPKSQRIAKRSKRHAPPQMVLAARQGQFAWFGYRYW